MRWVVVVVLVLACGGKPAPRPSPPVPRAPLAKADPFAPWPMPMAVLAWTPDGIARIGELPSLPVDARPRTPWFVEPTAPVDEAAFDRIIAALRSERVPGLSLRGQEAIGPWLGKLRDLPELTALVLDDAAFEPAQLAAIDLPLHRIYLERTRVDDAAAIALLARNPALEVVDLEDTRVGDSTVQAIARLPGVHVVNLSGTRLTDAGGAALRAAAGLEIVDLGRTRVGAPTVAALRDLPIRELFLDNTRVGKELATLAGFAPGIRRFDVSNLVAYRPTDADVGWLAKAPELIEVGLSGSRVTDKLVLELAKLPKLQRVRLAQAPITIAAIRAIAARVDLREVDLAATPVDDDTGAQLVGGQLMQLLRLDDTAITDAALRTTPGPGLGELYLSRTKVTDAGLAIIDELHLIGLGLGGTAVGDPTLARIAKQRELRVLVLSKTKAGRAALAALGALTRMQSLYLDGTQAGDATIAALAGLHEARVLHLASTDVSDAALATLHTFGRLEELTLGDTRMTGGAAELDAWPRLRTLSLVGLLVGDAAVRSIAKRASLAMLDLSQTDVTDPGPLGALPELRILGLSQTRLSKDGEAAVRALRKRGIEVVQQ